MKKLGKQTFARQGKFTLVKLPNSPNYKIRWYERNRRRLISTETSDFDQAMWRFREFAIDRGTSRRLKNRSPDWRNAIQSLLDAKRKSSRNRKIPFDLDIEDILSLLEKTDFHCSLSGIILDPSTIGTGQLNPWAPSIDRIDNGDGYIRGNIRIVCLLANLAMNQFGYDPLLRLANGIVANASAHIYERPPEIELQIDPCFMRQLGANSNLETV